MTEENAKHPTLIIQFTGNEGEVLPVEPGRIAGILMPILGQIADMNECSFSMRYGAETVESFEEIMPQEEEE